MKSLHEAERRRVSQQIKDREADATAAKEVEFYAACVTAWYNTAFELDKSLFALSAGGIGLLITLLTTVGVSSIVMLVLYGSAIACFLACLVVILVIFSGNRKHIFDVLGGKTDDDKKLMWLDIFAKVLFGIGVVLAAVVGGMGAYNSYNKGLDMSKETKDSKTSSPTATYDSINGLGGFTKSITGIGKLNPGSSTTKPTPTPPPAPSPSSKNSK